MRTYILRQMIPLMMDQQLGIRLSKMAKHLLATESRGPFSTGE